MKRLSFRLHCGQLTWGVYVGEFLWTLSDRETVENGFGPASGSLVPLCRRDPGRIGTGKQQTAAECTPRAPQWAGPEGGADLCDAQDRAAREDAAPAPERLPHSRKWKVYTKSAAGSRCPKAEALAELARRPPTAMSAFETNPFADPVDINPFQVEAPTHSSL